MRKRIIEHLLLQYLGAFLLLLNLVACTSEQGPKKDTEDPRGELIYARQGNTPIMLSKATEDQEENTPRSSASNAPDLCIGFAYNPAKGLIGDPFCFRRRVLNVRYLGDKEFLERIEKVSSKKLSSEYNIFASDQSFNSNITQKCSNSSSFGLNFKIFRLGYERAFSSSFNHKLEFDSKHVYAELSVLCQDALYTLERAIDWDNTIRNKYLSPIFRSNLYNRPFKDLFSENGQYGPFIITQYITGGKANILYCGISKKKETSLALEEKMRGSVNASCSFKKDSFNIGFGGGDSSAMSNMIEEFFQSLQVTYETLGGGYALGFSAPLKINELKMDFSPWTSKLNDKSTHVLIDIPSGGFTPISEFVQEENFKKRIEYEAYNTGFSEPYIEIRLGNNGGIFQSTYEPTPSFPYKYPQSLYLILHTRHGDEISLRPIHENDKSFWQAQYEDEYNRKVKEIADYAHRYYNLDIRKTYYKSAMQNERVELASKAKFYPQGELIDGIQTTIISIDLFGLKEGKLKRCKHPYYYDEAKGLFMQYLYFVEGNKRYAFAIYDPYILDTYGLRKLFENAKEEALSIHDLRHFRIIGL